MNHSLIGVDVEARTSEWRRRRSLGSRPLLERPTRRAESRVLACRDRTSPIDHLADRYPVIRRLVGELSFRVAARRFIRSNPPGTPIPDSFGDTFPRFIRSLGNAACIEYVADVAELEMLRHKVRCAQRVRPLATLILSSLRPERLNGLRVVLHPSVCLVQSRFPIVTAWENNQTDDVEGTIERWVAEAAIVARPFLEVEVRRLPSGGYAFVRALSEAQTVVTAVGIATEVTRDFDLASGLRLLEDVKAIVGIQEAASA